MSTTLIPLGWHYTEPSKEPETDPFVHLLRIMGTRRNPYALLDVVGHLAIRIIAEGNPSC